MSRLAIAAGLAMLAACSPAGLLADQAPPALRAEAGPVVLTAAPARIVLDPPAGLRGRTLVLVLDRLSADRPPGVLYRVALDGCGPPLGHINFFNAASGGPATFRFVLPPGALPPEGPLTIVVTPESAPDPDARVQLGRIVLTAAGQP